ncbi:hypothetical protein [Paenibacillus eucommiae]|uniref:Isochorismatase family protein n=1 Tax=Paenibacillus eucommiae TaxID=1355755 RepID=A0ABS4J535_9BACL|nr:hypothetical protein [Paenibacillus eucommiae]MBP1994938.1 hypothetical protein [Paenibacillus eucommiae]
MGIVQVETNYYQQFDADLSRDVPGEGYGGWQRAELPLDLERTAVVVMHAWNIGSPEQNPGEFRAVEYVPRSYTISRELFPNLLDSVRRAGMKLFHVVGGPDYYTHYPGYRLAADLAGTEPEAPERIADDEVQAALRTFRSDRVYPGSNNREDMERCAPYVDFLPEAKPQGDEDVAATSRQLFALCKHYGISHLIYTGFAINGCLLFSPGGMADMTKHGILCSTIRQAVTAVENKETARLQLNKEEGLWRVALLFGFVYDVNDLTAAINGEEHEDLS